MKYLVCLLLSLAAGFGTYALGAVAWSTLDPEGAGARLLFTIPIALAGMAIPGILGMVCMVFRCDWAAPRRTFKPIPQPRLAALPHPVPQAAPLPLRAVRKPRPVLVPTATSTRAGDELELALAS